MNRTARSLDESILAEHPLPPPSGDGDKHDRGTVLVVGATAETPGALLLSGLAALRAGAGRLQVAAPDEVAPLLAVHLPEAKVTGFETGASGSLEPCDRLAETMSSADAVLIGSGTGDAAAGRDLLGAALEALGTTDGALVIDAGALVALGEDPAALGPVADRAVAMPNPGEASALAADDRSGSDGDELLSHLVDVLGCAVAVRAADTWLGAPRRPAVVERNGPVGLATSGSGDVLAGLIAGHLARGADPFTALLWAVHIHACAGRRLTAGAAQLGFLARELIDAIAAVRASLAHC